MKCICNTKPFVRTKHNKTKWEDGMCEPKKKAITHPMKACEDCHQIEYAENRFQMKRCEYVEEKEASYIRMYDELVLDLLGQCSCEDSLCQKKHSLLVPQRYCKDLWEYRCDLVPDGTICETCNRHQLCCAKNIMAKLMDSKCFITAAPRSEAKHPSYRVDVHCLRAYLLHGNSDADAFLKFLETKEYKKDYCLDRKFGDYKDGIFHEDGLDLVEVEDEKVSILETSDTTMQEVEESQDVVALENFIDLKEYEIVEAPADGDCCFHAILTALGLEMSICKLRKLLRDNVAEVLRNHKRALIAETKQNLLQNRGDATAVAIASHVFKKKIAIVNDAGRIMNLQEDPDFYILRRGAGQNAHYDALIKKLTLNESQQFEPIDAAPPSPCEQKTPEKPKPVIPETPQDVVPATPVQSDSESEPETKQGEAQAEAKRLAELEAKRIAEAEAKRIAEAEAEAEAKRLAEAEEAKRLAEQEREAKRIAEAKRLAEEAKRIAEAEAEAEAKRLAEEAKRLAKAEAEAKREAKRKRKAEAARKPKRRKLNAAWLRQKMKSDGCYALYNGCPVMVAIGSRQKIIVEKHGTFKGKSYYEEGSDLNKAKLLRLELTGWRKRAHPLQSTKGLTKV